MKDERCKTCLPFLEFKFLGIVIIGLVIGYAAFQFVEMPPSVRLILETKHETDTSLILNKISSMEKAILSIEKDIATIRRNLNNNKEEK